MHPLPTLQPHRLGGQLYIRQLLKMSDLALARRSKISLSLEKQYRQNQCPRFLYPVQPDNVSLRDPVLPSVDDILQNSVISDKRQLHDKTQLCESRLLAKPSKKQIFLHDPFDSTLIPIINLIFAEYFDSRAGLGLSGLLIQLLANHRARISNITQATFLALLTYIALELPKEFQQSQSTALKTDLVVLILQTFLLSSAKHFTKLTRKPHNYLHVSRVLFELFYLISFLVLSSTNSGYKWLGVIMVQLYIIRKLQSLQSHFLISILIHKHEFFTYTLWLSELVMLMLVLNTFAYQLQNLTQDLSYQEALHLLLNILTLTEDPRSDEATSYIFAIKLFVYGYMLARFKDHSHFFDGLSKAQRYFMGNPQLGNKSKEIIVEHLKHEPPKLDHTLLNRIQIHQKSIILAHYFPKFQSRSSLAQMLSYCHIPYGTVITREKEPDDNAVYFLLEGTIEIEVCKKTLNQLTAKEFPVPQFGQYSFYTQQGRSCTVRSVTDCRLLKISRQDFVSQLNTHDKELFQLQIDSIFYERNYPISCYCCNMKDHLITSCPMLTLQLDLVKLVQSHHLSNFEQARQPVFTRLRMKKSIHALANNPHAPVDSEYMSQSSPQGSSMPAYQQHVDSPARSKDETSVVKILNSQQQFQQKFNEFRASRSSIQSEKILSNKKIFHQAHGDVNNMTPLFLDYQQSQSQVITNVNHASQDLQEEMQTFAKKEKKKGSATVNLQKASTIKKASLQEIDMRFKDKPKDKNLTDDVYDGSIALSPIFQDNKSGYASKLSMLPSQTNFLQQPQRRSTMIKQSSQGKSSSNPRSGFSSFQAFSNNSEHGVNYNMEIDRVMSFTIYYPQHNI